MSDIGEDKLSTYTQSYTQSPQLGALLLRGYF